MEHRRARETAETALAALANEDYRECEVWLWRLAVAARKCGVEASAAVRAWFMLMCRLQDVGEDDPKPDLLFNDEELVLLVDARVVALAVLGADLNEKDLRAEVDGLKRDIAELRDKRESRQRQLASHPKGRDILRKLLLASDGKQSLRGLGGESMRHHVRQMIGVHLVKKVGGGKSQRGVYALDNDGERIAKAQQRRDS